jgi:hypothetical protein
MIMTSHGSITEENARRDGSRAKNLTLEGIDIDNTRRIFRGRLANTPLHPVLKAKSRWRSRLMRESSRTSYNRTDKHSLRPRSLYR